MHNAETIRTALQTWRQGWPETLLDFDPGQNVPSLYEDRADACWYLAGILTLPQVHVTMPRCPSTEPAHSALSIPHLLERLMVLCDRQSLDRSVHDFVSVYRMVMEMQENGINTSPLSQLIYREPDTTTTGFAD